MEIRTNKGTIHAAWAQAHRDGSVLMEIKGGSKRMAEIAEIFDGIEWIEWNGPQGDIVRHDGYSRLTSVTIHEDTVLIVLRKEDD